MGRKFTSGTYGVPSIGDLSVAQNTISTAQTNENLNITPNGTGIVTVNNALQMNATGEVRFANTGSTFYTAFKGAAGTGANVTWTLPATDGTSGQFLATNAAGVLSWGSAVQTVTDQTVSASTFYPTFLGVTSGNVSAVNVGSTKLTFIPSTGTLIPLILQAATITGSSSASGTLTLRGTSNGTKGTTAVVLDEGIDASSTATGTLRVVGGVGISAKLYVGGAQVNSSTITCTTITETSSIQFKENVSPLQNALDSILQLSGVMYDRKDGSYKGETGLIAEDVDKIIPNVVTKDVDGNPYGINYTKLVAYLVESIKTLNEEIVTLKSK